MGKVCDISQAVGNAPFLLTETKVRTASARANRQWVESAKNPFNVFACRETHGVHPSTKETAQERATATRMAGLAFSRTCKVDGAPKRANRVQRLTVTPTPMPIIPRRHIWPSLRPQRQRCQFAVHHFRGGARRPRQAASGLKYRAQVRRVAVLACCVATPPE